MVHVLVFQVNFPVSDRCQILHGAATWYLLLPQTLTPSAGMMYGLFRIDLYAPSYVGAIDVVVWQWEANLSDSERCKTLHIAALWCLLNPRALTSTVRPRHGQFLPRYSLAVKFERQGLATAGMARANGVPRGGAYSYERGTGLIRNRRPPLGSP